MCCSVYFRLRHISGGGVQRAQTAAKAAVTLTLPWRKVVRWTPKSNQFLSYTAATACTPPTFSSQSVRLFEFFYPANRQTSTQTPVKSYPPYYAPPLCSRDIRRWWPSSVRLSVCLVPDPKSTMEGHSKLKIGRKEAHDTYDPWPPLDVERSKVKVTRPLNTVTENQSYLRNGKAYELQAGCTDGVWWLALPTCAVTQQRQVAETPKLAGRFSVPRLTFHTNYTTKRS